MSTSNSTEIEAATADLTRATSELKAAFARVGALIRSGRAVTGEYVMRTGVRTAEVEAAIADRETARHAETEARARLARAQAAAAPTPLTPVEAAKEALRQHAIAVEAYHAAEAAFTARDAAYARAGRPGRGWSERTDLGAIAQIGGGILTIASISKARVEGFDVRAVEQVADGKTVPAIASHLSTSPDGGADQSMSFHAAPSWVTDAD